MKPRKPCDGTALDYRRHRRHGEEACPESKLAEALARRRYRRSRPVLRVITNAPKKGPMKKVRGGGRYIGNLPGQPGDEFRINQRKDLYE